MDGKCYYSNYFSVYVDGQKKYNPLDYFRMGIIEEISFFFFDVEEQPVIKNYVQKWCEN